MIHLRTIAIERQTHKNDLFADEVEEFNCNVLQLKNAPYYIVTMVLHNQDVMIDDEIKKLDASSYRHEGSGDGKECHEQIARSAADR